ncbi:MAG: hypothetical protein WCT33_03730 [Patescibacteria group bacterium]
MARTFETGYTPGMLKKEMLGGTFEAEKETRGEIEYQPFDDAIKSARERQTGDPSDPKPRFASDLHFTTAELLELEDLTRLKFFSGIKSPLARFHGVDAFFELQPDPERPDVIRVTIELTTDDNKRIADKADLLIHIPAKGLDPLDPKDKAEFEKLIADASKSISDKIDNELAVAA